MELLLVMIFILFITITCLAIILIYRYKSQIMYNGSNEKLNSVNLETTMHPKDNETTLEPISKQNITLVKKISVNEEQASYVANINDTLIQASFLKNWHGFALKSGQKIVGFGSYADYEKVPGATKIYKMIIDKDQQGRGYGKILLNMIIKEINSNDIWIDLHSDNAIAKNLYMKKFNVVSDDGVTTIMKLK